MLSRLQWMLATPAVMVELKGKGASTPLNWQDHYPEARVLAEENLPLPDHSVDLIFANLFLSWQPDLPSVLRDWKRCLSPNGFVMVSMLGLDTLRECRAFIDAAHRPALIDMHEVGDALVQAGFVDPVLDVERITVSYGHTHRVIEDLLASGFWFPPSLTAEDKARLCVENQIKTLTYEVIYAHAFVPTVEEVSSQESGVTKIPLSQIRRALKNSY